MTKSSYKVVDNNGRPNVNVSFELFEHKYLTLNVTFILLIGDCGVIVKL